MIIPKADWIIIGSQTKPYNPPKIEWLQAIVELADEAGVPVFLKDNLKPLLGNNLRQELPESKSNSSKSGSGTMIGGRSNSSLTSSIFL